METNQIQTVNRKLAELELIPVSDPIRMNGEETAKQTRNYHGDMDDDGMVVTLCFLAVWTNHTDLKVWRTHE